TLLSPALSQSSDAPAAIVSDRFWRANLASDLEVIGASVSISGKPVTLIGVVSQASMQYCEPIRASDFWVTSSYWPLTAAFGRLRPGVSLAAASAELRARTEFLNDAAGRHYIEVREGLLVNRLPPSLAAAMTALLTMGLA